LYAKDPQAGGLPGPHRICGQHDFAMSNRISYEYDLRGPSVTLKSACSSSMMALHDAVRSIQPGDCDSAIVTGASLIFTPTTTGAMVRAHISFLFCLLDSLAILPLLDFPFNPDSTCFGDTIPSHFNTRDRKF
jgi:hypothetical protein